MLASGQAREQRKALHLSVREVAQALGKSAGTVSRWENGRSQPKTEDALHLAAILSFDLADAA